jgi:TfoX/Sxy family transcriptional regulator of competence genes
VNAGAAYASPEERYDRLVQTFLSTSDATLSTKKGFGSSALWVSGKIFAMLVRGQLVVKLPQQRVDAVVGSGGGQRFQPGTGRLMKEWLVLAPSLEEEWLNLATEALQFVSSKR